MATQEERDRVKRRLGYNDPTLTNAQLDDYIDDAKAFVSRETRTTWVASNPLYELARSCWTDLAVIYAIIRPSGGVIQGLKYKIDEILIDKGSQRDSQLKTVQKYEKRVREQLASLQEDEEDVPVTNTGPYG